jgi:glycine cleavage system aminomethyltransferase T
VSVAFLSPAGVLLRTPMDALHRSAGARIEERDGWAVAVYPERESPVWVADVSMIGKVELRGPADGLHGWTGGLEPGSARLDGAVRTLRLTPTRALALGDPHAGANGNGALDLTCAWAAVRIGGPQVRELFARLSALDVRPKSFPPDRVMLGSVARCPGVVVSEGDDRLLLMVGWEYGAYLWETVLDAGAPLGVAPRTGAP